MSYAGRMNRLVEALQLGGYYPKDKPLPGCVDILVEKGLMDWLNSKKGKNVSRVINTFRVIQAEAFIGVEKGDVITSEIRRRTKEFIEKHRKRLECSSIPETEIMQPWELSGSVA